MYLTQILLSLDFLVIRRKGRREMEEWQNFFFFFNEQRVAEDMVCLVNGCVIEFLFE
jgi:hypothetical protein